MNVFAAAVIAYLESEHGIAAVRDALGHDQADQREEGEQA